MNDNYVAKELQRLHGELGSWAKVAEYLGLPGKRAYVYKAAKGAIITEVYAALSIKVTQHTSVTYTKQEAKFVAQRAKSSDPKLLRHIQEVVVPFLIKKREEKIRRETNE